MKREELNEVLRNHKRWLEGDGGERADLSNSDLRDSNLSNADLRDLNLRNSDLRAADLRFSDLSNSDLWNSNLSNADLMNADLRFSNLRAANLSNSDFRYADLMDADLSNADLRFSDLRGAYLRNADLQYANLRGCKGFIPGPQRSDGYQFMLQKRGRYWKVMAGCRNMTIPAYRKHVKTYDEDWKIKETIAILDYLGTRLKDIAK